MIFHFVPMVIIMMAGVDGVNGFDLRADGQEMDYCQLLVKYFFGILWVNSVFKWIVISQLIFISYLKSLSPNDEMQIILGNTYTLQ